MCTPCAFVLSAPYTEVLYSCMYHQPRPELAAPVARWITAVPVSFIYFAPPASPYCEQQVYTHTYLTAHRLYMNYRWYQITLQWNIFTQISSSAKCWLDIYHWGAGLAVTGPIRHFGQSVLQSYFETGSGSSHSYCHILLLIAFL